jgi:hypothetical protein
MPLENRATTLFNSSDVETGTAAVPLRVDPTGTTPQPVTGTVTANQGTAAAVASAWPILVTDGVDTAEVDTAAPGAGAAGLVVRVAGSVSFSEARPATATVTSTSVTNVNTNLLASNANRLGALFWNDSNATNAFIKLGTTATTASFSVRLAGKSLYEIQSPVYTGNIDAITLAGSATVLTTELTP